MESIQRLRTRKSKIEENERVGALVDGGETRLECLAVVELNDRVALGLIQHFPNEASVAWVVFDQEDADHFTHRPHSLL